MILVADNNNITRLTRLDPLLKMDEIGLDDSEAIPRLKEKTEDALTDLQPIIQQLAWHMLATLFCFEFSSIKVQHPDSTVLICCGRVFCRYQDDPVIMEMLERRYGCFLDVLVQGQTFKIQQQVNVEFEISAYDEMVEISLINESGYAPISGLPETAENILFSQEAAGQKVMTSLLPTRKRKRGRSAESPLVSLRDALGEYDNPDKSRPCKPNGRQTRRSVG